MPRPYRKQSEVDQDLHDKASAIIRTGYENATGSHYYEDLSSIFRRARQEGFKIPRNYMKLAALVKEQEELSDKEDVNNNNIYKVLKLKLYKNTAG